ncbi:MAG: PIG-L family deacetylase [Clostridia bacterium]|nr:PIG-L family deacetylase [Clostridia bacterium]
MRILVVAAHPDDEVLGLGGTLALLSGEHEIYTLIVTDGSSTQYAGEDVNKILDKKRVECKECNRVLGVKDVIFGDLPDMCLDTVPHVDINALIHSQIKSIEPDWVFTHHSGDLNMDHKKVYESTMVAVRPVGKHRVKRVFAYETPSSTEWNGYDHVNAFIPNWFFDITQTLPTKIDAINCYRTEKREFPHPRSIEAIKAQAGMRGLAAGVAAAEAFSVIKGVGI